MNIAIVVHGRFHAFDLARELLGRGHQVTVFTNYPGWAVERFGLSRNSVRSFTAHGILTRLAARTGRLNVIRFFEAPLHRFFGQWAAQMLSHQQYDVVHCWSGISEELLRMPKRTGELRLLMRGSAHIRTQHRLLIEEEQRVGVPIDRPSRWMIAREEREYALAERILVLSTFARNTFITQNVPAEKLVILPLGVDLTGFRPSEKVVEERCCHILAGEVLRILYTGALSFQKGMWDLAQIICELSYERFHFRLVGPMALELAVLMPEIATRVMLIPKQPQHDLPAQYAKADLFLFPTIQDGFAMVLSQAQASGLPILTTTNCSGADIISIGETGWVLPIRSPEAFIERLRWCDTHREALAAMVRRTYVDFKPRSWANVAEDFEMICALRETEQTYGEHS
jgi:glycosyltransferase involved in cell wall biosynthesis